MGRTAIVIGATGLVGNELLQQLLEGNEYSTVKVFVRRSLQMSHPKLVEQTVNFDHIHDHAGDVTGDVVFCCIGTTISKAGSQENFRKVDQVLPLEFAQIAKKNGVKKFILVSSLGANKNSSNFYLKVKGEAEENIAALNFDAFLSFRPSMLLGKRSESRLAESAGKAVMKGLSFVFIGRLKKYKAVEAKAVAAAMIKLSVSEERGFRAVESDEIQSAGRQ
jgi:uncharacterized protein YbjT (DUF2867 family)